MNQTAQSWWFIFYKDQLLLEKKEDGIYAIPCGESSPIDIKEKTTVHNITTLEGKNCKAFSLSSPIEESEQWIMIGLRASYEYLPLSHYQTAGKAHEILHWDRNSRFCSACGTPMEQKESIMKRCPKCGREAYPSISTAILVLVRKKDSLLLVHARNFKGTFNSLVAGFLETGETLEECVAREVKEETGLTLTSYKLRGLVTFISDKCEPELMCVFTANEYIGELTECNEGELYWIDKAVVPTLPTWEGDRVFLDLLLSGDERFFSLKLQYEGEKLVDKQVNLY